MESLQDRVKHFPKVLVEENLSWLGNGSIVRNECVLIFVNWQISLLCSDKLTVKPKYLVNLPYDNLINSLFEFVNTTTSEQVQNTTLKYDNFEK